MPSSLMGSNAFTIGPPYSDTMLFTSEVEASGLDYEIILQPPVLFWKLSSNRDSAPNTSNESRYSGKNHYFVYFNCPIFILNGVLL